jgi:hypothetical protein
MPSDEGLLILAALLPEKKKVGTYLVFFTVIQGSFYYIVTLLH